MVVIERYRIPIVMLDGVEARLTMPVRRRRTTPAPPPPAASQAYAEPSVSPQHVTHYAAKPPQRRPIRHPTTSHMHVVKTASEKTSVSMRKTYHKASNNTAPLSLVVNIVSNRLVYEGARPMLDVVLNIDVAPRIPVIYEVDAVYADGSEATIASSNCNCHSHASKPPYRVHFRVPCSVRAIAVHIWDGGSRRAHKIIPIKCPSNVNAVHTKSGVKHWVQAKPVIHYAQLHASISAGTLHIGKRGTVTLNFDKPFSGTILVTLKQGDTPLDFEVRNINAPVKQVKIPIVVPDNAKQGSAVVEVTYSGRMVVGEKGNELLFLPVYSGGTPLRKTVEIS